MTARLSKDRPRYEKPFRGTALEKMHRASLRSCIFPNLYQVRRSTRASVEMSFRKSRTKRGNHAPQFDWPVPALTRLCLRDASRLDIRLLRICPDVQSGLARTQQQSMRSHLQRSRPLLGLVATTCVDASSDENSRDEQSNNAFLASSPLRRHGGVPFFAPYPENAIGRCVLWDTTDVSALLDA